EVAVGLAIVLQFYRLRATVNSDEADGLRHCQRSHVSNSPMQLSTSFLAQVTPVEPSPVQAALTQLFPADNFVLLGVILALPLIGAFVNGVFGKRLGREAVTLMALSAVGLSFVASLVAFFM